MFRKPPTVTKEVNIKEEWKANKEDAKVWIARTLPMGSASDSLCVSLSLCPSISLSTSPPPLSLCNAL